MPPRPSPDPAPQSVQTRRAAIYARFSSDRQKDRSISDQIALCREVCVRENFSVADVFEDRAVSGSSTVNRTGYLALMRAAKAQQFDVIVAEDMDRLFRDQADYHVARKDFDFLGIAIHTASGQVTRIDGALRALMGEMYIENLKLHTRRGMEGVIRDGRCAAGIAYGYRAKPGKPGERVIDEDQAAVVRRIFEQFAAGTPCRDIAQSLNADGIQAPRGRHWNASTINGNRGRSAGLILNELYCGRIVWNKTSFLKDPATGKRISRPNPTSAWRRAEAPHLRIIDEALFQRAQLRRGAAPERAPVQRHFHMLSGLVRCGACGGGMRARGQRRSRHGLKRNQYRLQCSNFVENGTCANGRRVRRDTIERLVLEGLRAEFTHPLAIAEYVKAYNAERRRLARDSSRDHAALERRLGELDREVDRLAQAIAKGRVAPETVADAINGAHAERVALRKRLELIETAKTPVAIHPAALTAYRRDIARLEELLHADGTPERRDLITTLRRLVDRIVVHAPARSTDLRIELHGRLAALVSAPAEMMGRGVPDGSGGRI